MTPADLSRLESLAREATPDTRGYNRAYASGDRGPRRGDRPVARGYPRQCADLATWHDGRGD